MHQRQDRYGATAIGLHWLMAFLIGTEIAIGLSFSSLPQATRPFWHNVHYLIGVGVLFLAIARGVWRFRHPAPALPSGIGRLNRLLAHTAHVVLYLMMAAVPILGAVAVFARGRGIDFGFLRLSVPALVNSDLAHLARSAHGLAAYALLTVVAVHIGAALYHEFIVGDRLLGRMIPKRA